MSSTDAATVALHSQPLELQSRPQHGDKVMVVGHGRDEAQLVQPGPLLFVTATQPHGLALAAVCRDKVSEPARAQQCTDGLVLRPATGPTKRHEDERQARHRPERDPRTAQRVNLRLAQHAPAARVGHRAGACPYLLPPVVGKGLVHPVDPLFGGVGCTGSLPLQQPMLNKATRSTRRRSSESECGRI